VAITGLALRQAIGKPQASTTEVAPNFYPAASLAVGDALLDGDGGGLPKGAVSGAECSGPPSSVAGWAPSRAASEVGRSVFYNKA
jgi:hypothetical protein